MRGMMAQCEQLGQELALGQHRVEVLENRITEQQVESGNKTAKLADMQKLRLVYDLMNECVFENCTTDMEFEEMQMILRVCAWAGKWN